MPRRNHKQKQGKHGPIIKVKPGVIVRQDARGKILLSGSEMKCSSTALMR
jgi:hypothetical protein